MIPITNTVSIPLREVEFKAVLAQGSGGQNVNKVSTAIQLFFDIEASSLPDRIKERLLAMKDHRITEEGVVVIKAQETRSQETNREQAIARLAQLVKGATVVPRSRKASRPSKRARTRRMDSKTRRGRDKSLRGRVRDS